MSRQSLINDLRALLPAASQPGLAPVEPRGARPGKRVSVPYREPPTTSGGIASPLTEPAYSAREWWPDGLPSSDGLLTLPAIKTMVLQDANGAEVIIQYAEPIL